MTIAIYIEDPATGIRAEVTDGVDPKALVVATRPLKTFENDVKYFTNDTYGVDMNVNAASGGTPVRMHDGIDSVLWTGTNISNTAVFNSAVQAYAGAQSISFTSWTDGAECQIAKGSDQDLTNYSSITMWIYVDNSWTTDSISFYGWNTATGLMVGNDIRLEDYAPVSIYDTWHKINVPLSDLGLENKTVDAFRFQYVSRSGAAANFYIDELILQETGSPIKFELKPKKGTWLHVYDFTFSFVDTYAGILENATMPLLAYDQILNESLAAGFTYARIQGGETKFTQTIKTLIDLLELPNTNLSSLGQDGTEAFITVRAIHTEPFILKSEDGDSLNFSVNDDLTGFIRNRITAGCKIEYR